MRPTTLRLWRSLHRWSSLIISLNMLILCLTGLVIIFNSEIESVVSGKAPAPPAASAEILPAETLVAAARRTQPDLQPRYLSYYVGEPGTVYVGLIPPGAPPDHEERWMVINGLTGDDAPLPEPGDSVTAFLTELHMNLFTGMIGQYLIGVVGVIFVISTVSGLVLYGPAMLKLAFGTLRFGRQTRIVTIDLHNLFGIATLLWALTVGLTGVILSFSPLVVGYWQKTELAALMARHPEPLTGPLISPDQAIAVGRAAFPDRDLDFVAYPGSAFSTPRHFVVMMRGRSELTHKILTIALVDGATGALAATTAMPWYVTVMLFSGPFHFGNYGGLPLKIVWALFTVVTTAVTVTGFIVWWKRPRRSKTTASAAVQDRART